ncbi:MAG: hypothetical protein LBD44_05480 [Spirochaetaceae bacterium]|jgi:hypothetical protein|nr:hypothetical protein [Spirochaetaceae bacterium]
MTKKIQMIVCTTLIVAVNLLTLLTLVACDDFFSTSWGEAREYELSKINLTVDNLEDWKGKAAGNPDLAAKLVDKIINGLDGKSGAEKAAFQTAGIELAIEQSGIGTTIVELAGKDISNIKDEDGLKDLLSSVQGKFSGDAAAGNIATIALASNLTGGDTTPSFSQNDPYMAQASASDVGMAVVVLALSLAPENVSSYDKLEESLPNLEITGNEGNREVSVKSGSTPSPEEKALAAYLNLIANDTTGKYEKNPITSGLKSAFNL